MKSPVRTIASFLVFFLACALLEAGLFPHLASRYPVGDPAAGNPLDPNREGPKCLTSGDLDGDGLKDVIVGNLDGSVSVLLSRGDEGMRDQMFFRAGGSIRSVVAADLNLDGSLDVAAADITEGVAVLLGNGDGTLRDGGKVPVGPARSLAVSDCNRDGAPDLLVAVSSPDCDLRDPQEHFLCLLPGKGDGSFEAPRILAGKDAVGCLYDVAFADVNRDGNEDALVLDYDQQKIHLFIGSGDGTFLSPIPGPQLALEQSGPRAFCAAYIDERLTDGNPPPGATLDIVVADRDSSMLAIFFGQGGIKFSRPVLVPAGDSPRSVAAGDLNGDGLLEIVVANRNANTISILKNLGEGRFSTPLEVAAGVSPREIVLDDLNGDGALDAAVANRISGDVSVLFGRHGLAGFLAPKDFYPAGITPVGIVAADFNEDGLPDAATVNLRSNDVRVRLNLGNGRFGEEAIYPVNLLPSSIASRDLNGDGHADLVAACMGTSKYTDLENRGSLVALLGGGDGTFTALSTDAPEGTSIRPYWLRLGDLSGDGIVDAAVGGARGELVLFRGRGDGGFESATPLRVESRGTPLTVALGDFDSDGRTDIATSRGQTLLNDGRLFEPGWAGKVLSFPVERGDWVVETADLDRDGALDLIVALTFVEPDPIAVYFGKGDGTFLPPTIYDTGMGVVSLQAADMDSDGILDIVSGNRCTADVTIMKGLGNRRFERLETIMTYSVEGVAVADLNGDGKLDLLGAGLALWMVFQGGSSSLEDPKEANFIGSLPKEGLYLNELMALNRGYFIDGEGRTPDWLEIYNHSAAARDLSGWILRQRNRDGGSIDWTFPAGTSIPAMGHQVVYCDGGSGPGLHASFSLNNAGETLYLLDPSRKIVDQVDYPYLPKDVSYARFADGARYLCYNPVPTLGSANVRPTNLDPSAVPANPFREAGGDRIGVTMRSFDDIGIAYAAVHFRAADQPSFSEMVLLDDGTLSDGKPGDGIFGALLPPFPAGTTVLCYFRVVDLDGQVSTAPGDPNILTDLFRLTAPASGSGLRISEVLAEGARSEDWIEIWNCGDSPRSLQGLALSKDYFDASGDWKFPDGTALQPGEMLVVECSGHPGDGLRAPFSLDKDRDSVLLLDAEGGRQVLDAVSFVSLPQDVSIGIAECGGAPERQVFPTPGKPNAGPLVPFARGDANADGGIDIADAIHGLLALFGGGEAPQCLKSADADDSGDVDVSDPVYILGYLFLGGTPPPEPFENCGPDLTPDALECRSFPPGCAR